MKLLLVTLLLFTFSLAAKDKDQEIDDLAVMYAECTAYNNLLYGALERSDVEPTTLEKIKSAYSQTMFASVVLASQSRTNDMAVKVTESRVELFIKDMTDEIDTNFDNFSILMNRYGNSCIEAIKKPDARLVDAMQLHAKKQKTISGDE